MSKEAMKLALEALENSIDLVSNEAREAEKMYANVPTRLARVQGLVALEVAHEKAITALREASAEQPAQQEPVTWGVDWGRAGDIPCVSIIKRLVDGRIEVVAVEYGPTPSSWIEVQQVKWEGDKLLAKLKEKNT